MIILLPLGFNTVNLKIYKYLINLTRTAFIENIHGLDST